jgi:hypothetical protein
MMMRLETVAEDLAIKVRTATPLQQRRVCLIACQLALQATKMDLPIITTAIEEIRVRGVLSNKRIEELNNLVDELDNLYFDLQERSELDPKLQLQSMLHFSQARAVSALSFAGGQEELTAAMETIYEASVVFDDPSIIFNAVTLKLEAKF